MVNQGNARPGRCYIKGWFTLATESEAESESKAQGGLRSSVNQKEERKRSRKLDGIGVGRIRRVSFSSDSSSASFASVASDPVRTRLTESEAELSANQKTLQLPVLSKLRPRKKMAALKEKWQRL